MPKEKEKTEVEKLDMDGQAEFAACLSFLKTKSNLPEVVIEGLKATPLILIQTAKALKADLDKSAVCNQLSELKLVEKEYANDAINLMESELILALQPKVEAMISTGAGSVNQSVSIPFDNGAQTLTATITAHNLAYNSDEAKKRSKADSGIPKTLKGFVEARWNKMTKLAIVKRGTSKSGGFTLAKIEPRKVGKKLPTSGIVYSFGISSRPYEEK